MVDTRVRMRQEQSGRWRATASGREGVSVTGSTRERCLANLRRALRRKPEPRDPSEPVSLVVVESEPLLAGVAEAAEILGWDKRRVITYIDRGNFPKPVQSLAGGRVWLRSDVEDYSVEWQARRSRRRSARPPGAATDAPGSDGGGSS